MREAHSVPLPRCSQTPLKSASLSSSIEPRMARRMIMESCCPGQKRGKSAGASRAPFQLSIRCRSLRIGLNVLGASKTAGSRLGPASPPNTYCNGVPCLTSVVVSPQPTRRVTVSPAFGNVAQAEVTGGSTRHDSMMKASGFFLKRSIRLSVGGKWSESEGTSDTPPTRWASTDTSRCVVPLTPAKLMPVITSSASSQTVARRYSAGRLLFIATKTESRPLARSRARTSDLACADFLASNPKAIRLRNRGRNMTLGTEFQAATTSSSSPSSNPASPKHRNHRQRDTSWPHKAVSTLPSASTKEASARFAGSSGARTDARSLTRGLYAAGLRRWDTIALRTALWWSPSRKSKSFVGTASGHIATVAPSHLPRRCSEAHSSLTASYCKRKKPS
mmetsp:Transcript_51911/g.116541  ORF Transcript_51911/g.116541 Transcript_51911/m.116541 type:complete len:391 (+) Transcript_51911:331-1503(+)